MVPAGVGQVVQFLARGAALLDVLQLNGGLDERVGQALGDEQRGLDVTGGGVLPEPLPASSPVVAVRGQPTPAFSRVADPICEAIGFVLSG